MMTSTTITLVCIIVFLFGSTVIAMKKAMALKEISEEEYQKTISEIEGYDIDAIR